MDVTGILDEMRTQQALMKECIVALERLVAQKPRRGRPPQWLSEAREEPEPTLSLVKTPAKRGRRLGGAKKRK